jgi:hypothetical protein
LLKVQLSEDIVGKTQSPVILSVRTEVAACDDENLTLAFHWLSDKEGEPFKDGKLDVWSGADRMTTDIPDKLRELLVTGGVDKLLSLSSQFTEETPSGDSILTGSYALYFREIFFHIPFLIADALQRNQQFEHAKKWYQYIFDPTRPAGDPTKYCEKAASESGVWRYRPFRGHTVRKLTEVISDPAGWKELEKDPFDPHAIAQTRLGAYEKAVAMKYLENLLSWGDMLFALDTREGINQAAVLYVRALSLLGPKPQPHWLSGPPAATAPTTVRDLIDGKKHKPKKNTLADIGPIAEQYQDPFFDVADYFSLPENEEFAGYWDKAQDRLFKIRHCMNIKGIVRQLPLFEPPVDPRQLIRAMAAGGGIEGAALLQSAAVPHYRFGVVLQQAKNLTSTVIQLGTALLSALERKDGEDLNLLRSTQEQAIRKMMRAIKAKQVEDGAQHLEALKHSLEAAQHREEHYSGLIEGGYSESERVNLGQEAAAMYLQLPAADLKGIATAGHLIPTIFGLADGGVKPGDALMTAAQVVESAASALQMGAGMAATIAQFERRKEDWDLQKALAGFDVQQIQAELGGAEIRQTILERDLEIHDKVTEQSREKEEFYRSKFGNKELYQWMSGRLSTVYFQTYKLAVEVALSAQRAYQYERCTDDSFINPGQWDSLRKGLLAGEGLMLGLNQLEKAHLDGDERELEIEKTISLRQLAPKQLLALKEKGRCSFSFTEKLFDWDFPGHYCRRIKSVTISIPAVVGPYQNVHATLTQISDRVLIEANVEAVKALLLAKENSDGNRLNSLKEGVLRSGWRPPKQQIAISRGIDDSGMFQLDFRDERYLPFEGTGAVSDWELNLPKGANRNLDYASISDVIVHLRYTALDGGEVFRRQLLALDQIKTYSGVRLLSLRQEFSAEWQKAQIATTGDNNRLQFKISEELFPMNLKHETIKPGGTEKERIVLYVIPKDANTTPSGFTLNDKPADSSQQVEAPGELGDWWIKGTSLDFKSVADIILIVPFTGELDWGSAGSGT